MSPLPQEPTVTKSALSEGEDCITTKENESNCLSDKKELTRKDYDDFYDSLINEAPYIAGDICELIPASEIPWIQPKLIQEGREFFRNNFLAIVLANTAALMYGFSLKNESVVLLRTGKFHKEDDAFIRYISTAARIQSWYDDDILSVDSVAYRNCQLVRKMHTHAAKSKKPLPTLEELQPTVEKAAILDAIRADLQYVDTSEAPQQLLTWTPTLELSQYDMTMTQFGFIGVVYMFPRFIGIGDMKGLDGFLHLWAVIGRLLGIEDRFNLALYPDPELYHRFFINVVIASLKTSDMTVISLQNALMMGLGKRLPFVSMKAFMYMGFKDGVPGFQGNNLYALMNWYDKMCYIVMIVTSRLMARFTFMRDAINWFTRGVVKTGVRVYLPKKKEN